MDKRLFRTLTAAILVCMIPVLVLWKFTGILYVIGLVIGVLRPLIIGGAIAFILNRPFNKIHGLLNRLFRKTKLKKLPYLLSLVLIYLLLIGLLLGLFFAIIPQFIDSISTFISSFDDYYNNAFAFFTGLAAKYNIDISDTIERYGIWDKLDIGGKLSELSKMVPDLLGSMVDTTRSILGVVTDVIIGIVISVYLLAEKAKYKVQFKKVLRAALPEKWFNKTVGVIRTSVTIFGNFVNGQLIEACILGVLCFIGMTIFGFPYALLISVIMGMTNVIPIVGPILGTIPAVFVLLMAKPESVLWFLLFIITLQQLESNLIYPRVVGNSVGLPALWVLLSITVGGGLGGVLGMAVAVPFASVAYEYTKRIVNARLAKKQAAELVENPVPEHPSAAE
ncbi:MAG: AI-2E family transporter [Oscillospiraceae bacterium]